MNIKLTPQEIEVLKAALTDYEGIADEEARDRTVNDPETREYFASHAMIARALFKKLAHA